MRNLRKKFDMFCYRHSNWGIPNLMLYIAIGCGLVSLASLLGYYQIYDILCFDRNAILHGQVWRLITPVFTMGRSNILTTLIFLYCTYSLGRAVERAWGTLKFNLYYLCGLLLMDAFALAFSGSVYIYSNGQWAFIVQDTSPYFAGYMPIFLNISLLICFSTIYPDTQFLLLYIIPIKARLLSLFYFAYIIFEIVRICVPVLLFPICLFPLVAFLNYLLFFGKDIFNLLPNYRQKPKKAKQTQTKSAKKSSPDYQHRCVICGRTDVSNPELEFRYCSRCNGYFCYCEDHINNHTHIE